MKFIVQRVSSAACRVDDEVTGSIQKGFMVLIGISDSDTKEIADKMIKKLIGLRIFEDSEGKTNLSLKDVNGSLLLISQFTLYADCRKGNRPSFTDAGKPDMAKELYHYIIESCKNTKSDQFFYHFIRNLFRIRIGYANQYHKTFLNTARYLIIYATCGWTYALYYKFHDPSTPFFIISNPFFIPNFITINPTINLTYF